MRTKQILSAALSGVLLAAMMSLGGCAGKAEAQTFVQNPAAGTGPLKAEPAAVYFTGDISPVGLMAVYEALGLEASGKVSVKISTGEPGNTRGAGKRSGP